MDGRFVDGEVDVAVGDDHIELSVGRSWPFQSSIDGCRSVDLIHTSTDVNTCGRLDLMPRSSRSDLPLISTAACCTLLTDPSLSATDAEKLAHALKAVADPARLQLLSMVSAHDGGEACICDLTGPVGLSQPTVSHHMKILVDAGLLERDQRGKWAYYRLVPGALDELASALTGEVKGREAALAR
jgi:ArsR family transcriptional regulator